MLIDFPQSFNLILDVIGTGWNFDGNFNDFTCSRVFFPLSLINTAVCALAETTLFFTPADFKDFLNGLKFTKSAFFIERLRNGLVF